MKGEQKNLREIYEFITAPFRELQGRQVKSKDS